VKSITITVAILLISTLSFPAFIPAAEITAAELFHKGSEAYSRGDYEQAITDFETITRDNGFSAQVLYNLAGSYAQAGKTGKAVLNYERALRLAPSDSDTLGNLALLRKENGLFQTDVNGTARFFRLLNLNQWAIAILFVLGLCILFVITKRTFAYSRATTITITLSCLALLTLSLYGTFRGYQEFNPLVVIEPNARLLVSPFDSSVSIGAIGEGRLMYPLKEHKGYSYVKDETGRTGWILNSMVEPVCKQPGME